LIYCTNCVDQMFESNLETDESINGILNVMISSGYLPPIPKFDLDCLTKSISQSLGKSLNLEDNRKEPEMQLDEDDIKIVINNTNVSRAEACEALLEHRNIIDAIIALVP
jgi:hypothetical protein